MSVAKHGLFKKLRQRQRGQLSTTVEQTTKSGAKMEVLLFVKINYAMDTLIVRPDRMKKIVTVHMVWNIRSSLLELVFVKILFYS